MLWLVRSHPRRLTALSICVSLLAIACHPSFSSHSALMNMHSQFELGCDIFTNSDTQSGVKHWIENVSRRWIRCPIQFCYSLQKIATIDHENQSLSGRGLGGKTKRWYGSWTMFIEPEMRFVLDHAGFNLIGAGITHLLERFKSSSVNGTEKEENGGRQYH